MKRSWIVVAVVGVLALAACGGGSSTASGGSTIKITMSDNAFEPASVQVRKGEAVTFEFTNAGPSSMRPSSATKPRRMLTPWSCPRRAWRVAGAWPVWTTADPRC